VLLSSGVEAVFAHLRLSLLIVIAVMSGAITGNAADITTRETAALFRSVAAVCAGLCSGVPQRASGPLRRMIPAIIFYDVNMLTDGSGKVQVNSHGAGGHCYDAAQR
jgi:hypothetical protein